jgi:hypothetical protein
MLLRQVAQRRGALSHGVVHGLVISAVVRHVGCGFVVRGRKDEILEEAA